MCPSIAVLAGGGDMGGGGGGSAGDGSGDNNAGAGGGADGAGGDGKGAPDYKKYPECGHASHPVDVVTGRAFTHPITDLFLPGPLDLEFRRMYSSKAADRDMGLGYGWAHTFGWEVEVQRRRIVVWNEQGASVDFPVVPAGGEVVGPWGWVLRREPWGFAVDAGDGLWRIFSLQEGARHRLTAIEDRNRNRIALTYDDGRLVEVKDSAGRIVRVASTREGRIASLEVQNAVSRGQWVAFARYLHDDAGNLVSATDADGFSSRYAYDEAHRLTADTDRAGLTFRFLYDAEGRCVESWGDYAGHDGTANRSDRSLAEDAPRTLADGTRARGVHHCRFLYHKDGYSEVTDSTSVRRFFGNEHGTLDKRVEGGGVVNAAYDDGGHLVARTDQLGATTTFERDARGRVLRMVDPLGHVTTIERDALGLPVRIADPAGRVTAIERDRFGNMTAVTDALGAVTKLRHDDRGLVTEIVDPRGYSTRTEYDEQGNPAVITCPNGASWRFSYDAFGRRTSVVDPLGAETRYTYSARGDVTSVTEPDGSVTRYGYDGERHLTQIVDAKGGITQVTWGGYHVPCERRDPAGNAVRFRYNREGELVTIHNERGEVHRFEYDASGILVAERTFDGREIRYRNDLLGRPIRIEDGLKHKTQIKYDLAGRVIARELWDGSVESFEYDPRGDLVAARGPDVELRFERDALGRITREIQVVGGEEQHVEVTYDADGHRVGRATSLGFREEIERDGLGARVRTSLDGRASIEHARDPLGREIARRLPRGGCIESEYDRMGRLTRRRLSGPGLGPSSLRRPIHGAEPAWIGRQGGPGIDTEYRYGAGLELIEEIDAQLGRIAFEYDPLGQLLARLPEKARAELFRYDRAGNLHDAGADAEARGARVHGPGGRLQQKGDTEYVWDDAGRLVEKRSRSEKSGAAEVWAYRWNAAGLLGSVQAPDGTLTEFTYDPFARRLGKHVSRPARPGAAPRRVSRTHYVWDGDVLVHEIREAAREGGDPVVEEKTYCFEDNSFAPVAESAARPVRAGADTPRTFFHHVNDPAGTPERLLGDDGAIACELLRTAWGSAGVQPGAAIETPIRLQGQHEDPETGLCYNRFRYFDPDTGGFLSADPLGIEAGLHPFAFDGAPTKDADPLGLGPSLAEIRQAYKDEVTAIGPRAKARLCAGEDPEAVARDAHRERREIGQKYKALTPWPQRWLIYARNRAPKWLGGQGYDSIYGPSYEQLRRRGKTPEQIIESAARPNDAINKKFGVK